MITILTIGGLFAVIGVLSCLYFTWRYWVAETGRARPLPDTPQRDEATLCCADEGGVIVAWRAGELVHESIYEGDYYAFAKTWLAPMQGNSEPREWPKHFFDERLPRRAAE